MDSLDAANIDSQRISESIVVDETLKKWRGSENYRRVLAFEALDGERKYQESLHKKTGQDPISIPGELALLQVYLTEALVAYTDTFGDPGEKPTMDAIRKVTAIGLRALENYGCPLRDIEGSLAARPAEHRAGSVEAKMLDAERAHELDVKSRLEAGPVVLPPIKSVDGLSIDVEKYLDLLRYAPIAITKLDIRFARAQAELLKDITTPVVEVTEPIPPSTENISEADVSKDESKDPPRPVGGIIKEIG